MHEERRSIAQKHFKVGKKAGAKDSSWQPGVVLGQASVTDKLSLRVRWKEAIREGEGGKEGEIQYALCWKHLQK